MRNLGLCIALLAQYDKSGRGKVININSFDVSSIFNRAEVNYGMISVVIIKEKIKSIMLMPILLIHRYSIEGILKYKFAF